MAADGKLPFRWLRGFVFSMVWGLATVGSLPAQSPGPGPPPWLKIVPNGIEDPALTMEIEIGEIAPEETVRLQILQDCNGDGQPDFQGKATCQSPIEERASMKAGGDKIVHDRLIFQEIDQALRKAGKSPLPRKQPLWLYAARKGAKQGSFAVFGLVERKDICTIWQVAIHILGGRCNPGRIWELGNRAKRRETDTLFEIRRLANPAENQQILPVPRTLGATGVAWADTETLLVTVGGAAARSTSVVPGRLTGDVPITLGEGLWRIPLAEGIPKLLWAKPDGELRNVVAPLQLPGGWVAFARQSPGEQTVEGEEPAAILSFWNEGKLYPENDIPLSYKILQLLASDAQGKTLLALAPGVGADRPVFLQIDRVGRTVVNLGYDPALFQAAMSSPGGENSVMPFEDNSGQSGWDLLLVDKDGKFLKELQTRKEDDLLPAWSPSGKEVAFLAEVDRREIKCENSGIIGESVPKEGKDPIERSIQPPLLAPAPTSTPGLCNPLQQNRPSTEVFDRLLVLLESIPQRWAGLRIPLVPFPLRSASEPPPLLPKESTSEFIPGVEPERSGSGAGFSNFSEVTEERRNPTGRDLDRALKFMSELVCTPLTERSAAMAQRISSGELTNADLWAPTILLRSKGRMNAEDSALIVEAWLQWAEALKRRDALFDAASAALDLVIPRKNLDLLKDLADRWGRLSSREVRSAGKARLARSRGEILFRFGDHPGALEAYGFARGIFYALGDPHGQGKTWIGEGDTLFRQGKNEQAREAFRRARELFQTGTNSRGGVGDSFKGEGDVFSRLGEEGQASDAYDKALEAYRAAGSYVGMGYAWIGKADLLRQSQRFSEAISAYHRASSLFHQVGLSVGEGSALKGKADVQLDNKCYEEALGAYRQARELYHRSESKHGEGGTFLGEARAHLSRQDWQRVTDAAKEAIFRFTSRQLIPDRIQALLLEARGERELGHGPEALAAAREAIQLHQEQWRLSSITDQQRTALDEPISAAYDIVIPAEAGQSQRAASALTTTERARSRVLLDLLATGNPGVQRSVPHLDTQQRMLRAKLSHIDADLARTAAWQERQELLRQRILTGQKLQWNSYERIALGAGFLPTATPLSAEEVRRLALEAKSPLLVYYAAPAEVWGFLILPNSTEILLKRINITRKSLADAIHGLTYDLSNGFLESRFQPKAHALWNLLIAPFAEALPESGPLVVIPHGPLHELPFEALLDAQGKAVFERWHVSFAPSASALAFARKRHRAPRPDDAFVAFASGSGLSRPNQEIAEVATLFGAKRETFQTNEAHFQNYQRFAPQARHLLLATHGVHVQGSRTETYLEIQPTHDVHDRRLTAAEIAAIPLNAELVTLSACDTSYGEPLHSDERLDLTRAFLIAGAGSVLATRWKIPEDVATSKFLADFYRAYRAGGLAGKGLRKDEALEEARQRSRKRGDPAQVWAAWVLVGDGQ